MDSNHQVITNTKELILKLKIKFRLSNQYPFVYHVGQKAKRELISKTN